MRALGHIRDDERPAGVVHPDHLVGGIFVPESVTLPARIDDQQGQSCTGSYALLVESFCAARGIPCDPVSRRFTYTLGRQLVNPGVAIVDVGARPSAVVDGMRTFGVVPEPVCPSGDLANINEPLDFFALERALTFRVKDIAVIEDEGEARCAAIRQALAASYPVGMGIYVDDAFEGWRGEDVYDGNGGGGGHALRIVGYKPGAFLIANSWSAESWGFRGFCWMSDRFIGGPNVFDVYALNFAAAVRLCGKDVTPGGRTCVEQIGHTGRCVGC